MFYIHDTILLFTVLFSTNLVIESKTCNPEYLKNSNIILGIKENFNFYPWTVHQPLRGTVDFMKINDQFVKELCKYYLSDSVMEVILLNLNLDYIEPGFFTSNHLEQVHIEGNNLKKITNGVFNGTSIKTLILAENKIELIEESAFENMINLEAISLDYNNIKVFSPDWFAGAKKLYEISMDHNNITQLPEDTTKNMAEHFDRVPAFRIYGCLDFDNNNIKYIHNNAFGNLKHFGVISLSNNDIQFVNANVFNGFDFLFSLFMNTNRFICFSNKTMDSLHGVKRLFLANNQLNSDCKVMLKEYFDSKNNKVYF